MARNTGAKCRLCRREGVKLYLKGARCQSEKCGFTKRSYAPGQHGNARKGKLSGYGIQLREKQKVKKIYGILEKQFSKYVKSALDKKGVSGDILMQSLETRLDNMVYRSGFTVSRSQSRQLIRSGFFTVNAKKVLTPSYQVKVGDLIKPTKFEKLNLRGGFVLPEWIEANVKDRFVKFERMPKADEITEDIKIQLVIEYYSR